MYKFNNIGWSMTLLFTNNSFFIPLLYNLTGNETINYVYGSPKCCWSGGRLSNINIKSINFIEKIIYKIKDYNVIPSFTFTNTGITKELLKDEFCNILLKIISESNSEIILVSELLYEHIKNKYPNIKLCASVLKSTYQNIKDKDETQHINALIEKYDRVVIRPEYAIEKNGNFNGIKDISKIELIVNQACAMNCDCANEDYRLIELLDRGLITQEEYETKITKICPRDSGRVKETNIIPEVLINKCIKAGVTKLKINGRHLTFDELFIVLNNYFFSSNIDKNELKNKINNYILSTFKKNAGIQLQSLIYNN